MSLDTTQLNVLAKSGSPKQQKMAKRVLPIRKDGHVLLITLLLANMIGSSYPIPLVISH
jgi:metal transporter CNNM